MSKIPATYMWVKFSDPKDLEVGSVLKDWRGRKRVVLAINGGAVWLTHKNSARPGKEQLISNLLRWRNSIRIKI